MKAPLVVLIYGKPSRALDVSLSDDFPATQSRSESYLFVHLNSHVEEGRIEHLTCHYLMVMIICRPIHPSNISSACQPGLACYMQLSMHSIVRTVSTHAPRRRHKSKEQSNFRSYPAIQEKEDQRQYQYFEYGFTVNANPCALPQSEAGSPLRQQEDTYIYIQRGWEFSSTVWTSVDGQCEFAAVKDS